MIDGEVDKQSIAGASVLAIIGIVIGIHDASVNGDLLQQATKITTDSTLLGDNLFTTIGILCTVVLVAIAMYSIRCMA
jgi:hypothetical protein